MFFGFLSHGFLTLVSLPLPFGLSCCFLLFPPPIPIILRFPPSHSCFPGWAEKIGKEEREKMGCSSPEEKECGGGEKKEERID